MGDEAPLVYSWDGGMSRGESSDSGINRGESSDSGILAPLPPQGPLMLMRLRV